MNRIYILEKSEEEIKNSIKVKYVTYINKNYVFLGISFMIFSSMKQRNGALRLLEHARVQREERGRLPAAVILILLLWSPSFFQLENLGFRSLRLVLSNSKMHFEKKT